MSDDITTRLRRDCMSLIADEAADTIERLRKERDAARRQCCTAAVSRPLGNGTVYNCEDAVKEATRRGWDCFGQDNWPSTKDRSEPDAEPQTPEA